MTQPFGEPTVLEQLRQLMKNAATVLESRSNEEHTEYPILAVGKKRWQLIGCDHEVDEFTAMIVLLPFRIGTFPCGIIYGRDKDNRDHHGELVVCRQYVEDEVGDRVHTRWFGKATPIQYCWQTIPVSWLKTDDVYLLKSELCSVLTPSSSARAV
jgi:hypothetical protein